jgi:hypothetical protein
VEVQFNEINWASGVTLNITTRSSNSLASFTGQIEVDTSIEIDFPSNENELTFEFQLNDGSPEAIEINDAGEIYNITVRQIQCSNTDYGNMGCRVFKWGYKIRNTIIMPYF